MKFITVNYTYNYTYNKSFTKSSKQQRHVRIRSGVPYYAGFGTKRAILPQHWAMKMKDVFDALREIAPEYTKEAALTSKHYIRNFLVPISLYSEMYRDRQITREEYTSFLEKKEKEFENLKGRLEEAARAKRLEPYESEEERVYALPRLV